MRAVVYIFAVVAAIYGCGGTADRRGEEEGADREWQFTRPPPPVTTHDERPIQVDTKPTLIKQGPAPLFYMVEAPASVLVRDQSTGARLAGGVVPAGTIVRVESRGGIFFGTRLVAPGPLRSGVSYGIYVESDSKSAIITDSVAPSTAPGRGDAR